MANLYWVTFRLQKNTSYQRRYDALESTLSDASGGQWWKEPTSFYLFQSELSIGELTTAIKADIDVETDVVLVGMPGYKTARVVGTVEDDDLFTLWDWVKQV